MKIPARSILACILLLLAGRGLFAQTGVYDFRTGLTLQKNLGKKCEISLSPEWRMNMKDDPNEFLLETALSYEPFSFLELKGRYRFAHHAVREAAGQNYHQFALDLKGKYRIERFRFQLRTRLSNYSDFETGEILVNPYLRYRFKTEYNIKGLKLFPSAGLEVFHQLDDREINKIRYSLGLEYRLNKHNRIGFQYHLQDYLKKESQRNIFSLQYTILF